ncbi:MAG: nitroreductase family deazaflavin-dependent oxidoreductase, partial [SAR202 cluster bacterium]|nr:nitroreductase family deazaflavin-dependent oxidoreductase [SAR202 cluster bacterium]
NYILIATYGGNPNHPAWYYNLKANPKITIRDKTKMFDMIATEMPESPERSRLWALGAAVQPLYDEYQSKLERLVPLFLASPIS